MSPEKDPPGNTPESSEPRTSIWHISEYELFQMSQLARDKILNERTNRLYDALNSPRATAKQIDRILNREEYSDG